MSKRLSDTKTNTTTPKITDIFNNKNPELLQPVKRTSSILSLPDIDHNMKKVIVDESNKKHDQLDYSLFLEPCLTQFKSLRESVDNKVGSLEQTITK